MSNSVKPIPEGFHAVTPYLIIRGAAEALEFYKKAFGAVERFRMAGPDGSIGHAEIQIGDSIIMLADECPEAANRSVQALGGSPAGFYLYLENVDAAFQRAVDAGAKVTRPLEDKFYGDRSGSVSDPFGFEWSLASHVEDVAPEEMDRRLQAEVAKMAAAQNQ